jgi:hypothetical protein
MARYSTAEVIRLIMQEDRDNDEDSDSDEDVNSEDGDYLPGNGAESETEDHVSEESDESADATTSEEEQVRSFCSVLCSNCRYLQCLSYQ